MTGITAVFAAWHAATRPGALVSASSGGSSAARHKVLEMMDLLNHAGGEAVTKREPAEQCA